MDKLWRRSWNASWNAAPLVPAPARRSGPGVRKCLVSWPEELGPPRGGRPPRATSGSQPEAAREEGWARTGPRGGGDRFLSAPSAPPTSLAPDAGACHTRTHALLHLEGSSPGQDCSAFRTQLWPSSWIELSLKSPSPRMPCPSMSLLQFHRTDPLPCTRAATCSSVSSTGLWLPHAAALGGTYSGPPCVLGLEMSTCGCSCLSGRPWGQRGSSLSWATGAAWTQASTTVAPSHRQSPASAQPGVVRRGLQSQQACVCSISHRLYPSSWNLGFLLHQVGRTALHLGWGGPCEALSRS